MYTNSVNHIGKNFDTHTIAFNDCIIESNVTKHIFVNADIYVKNETVQFDNCVFVNCILIGVTDKTYFFECAFTGESHFIAPTDSLKFKSNDKRYFACYWLREPVVDETVLTNKHMKQLSQAVEEFAEKLNTELKLKSYNKVDYSENYPFDAYFQSNIDLGEFEMWLANSPFKIVNSYEDEDMSVGIPYHSTIHVVLKDG